MVPRAEAGLRMKRTPPWVFVAAVGVQLAALCLCIWAMERWLRAEEEAAAPPIAPPEPRPAPVPPSPSRPRPNPDPVPERFERPERAANGAASPAPAAAPWQSAPERPRVVTVRAVEPPAGAPMFGPPPPRPPEPPSDPGAAPVFLTNSADETTQILRGRAPDGDFAIGFYGDGEIRFVDSDTCRYTGKAESARARMRQIDGMRAFTVQIGAAADGRLQATFTGGPHDAETIALEPLVGWSVA
ncbi:MAG: hypothetical protein JWO66_270 [Candidatus Eremiobacteraeota bacterium]|nr:hypothetical protein [Candidatus Eremiobacteraeota bacterium]